MCTSQFWIQLKGSFKIWYSILPSETEQAEKKSHCEVLHDLSSRHKQVILFRSVAHEHKLGQIKAFVVRQVSFVGGE